jgi:hypothetical protein
VLEHLLCKSPEFKPQSQQKKKKISIGKPAENIRLKDEEPGTDKRAIIINHLLITTLGYEF